MCMTLKLEDNYVAIATQQGRIIMLFHIACVILVENVFSNVEV